MLGVIGGSGLYSLDGIPGLRLTGRRTANTRWGSPSSPVTTGELGSSPVAFLARHGEDHSIAPHRVNYRANVAALAEIGVTRILALGSVGGIGKDCSPGALVVPDQLIDYTSGREPTFAAPGEPVRHVDFTNPYSPAWRQQVLAAARDVATETEVTLVEEGVYGVANGPRFETAAEIARMRRDGCTVVGMTGMPETALAREADIPYAVVCPIGNRAAGIAPGVVDQDLVAATAAEMRPSILRLIAALV